MTSLAIIDYGMGNLFSIARAVERAGFSPTITGDADEVRKADAVLLPGVGAFGDAIADLARASLDEALRERVAAGRPLIGVCLGLQLLFETSEEFGSHKGLGLIKGRVKRLPRGLLKVPSVGWCQVNKRAAAQGTPLDQLPDGAWQYFVHSYVVEPEDETVIASDTAFGDLAFCSAVAQGAIFACQFHPERSGDQGLAVYEALPGWMGSL
ncbi:MAG: imidazole glycerol phosphate synthase subunit HisH [Magnetovibrionaceae bacterium]